MSWFSDLFSDGVIDAGEPEDYDSPEEFADALADEVDSYPDDD